MPEFYTRFRGRSDLMEYAKVRGARAATPCPRTPFPGGCLGQHGRLSLTPCLGGEGWSLCPRCPPFSGATVPWAPGPLCLPFSCHPCCVCYSGDNQGCDPGRFLPLNPRAADCPLPATPSPRNR